MDTLNTTITLILGLLFRLAIPICITVLIVWVLKKLDAHWQNESIQTVNPVTSGIKNPGCWKVHNCTEEKRAACNAYAHVETPCWQIHRESSGQLQERCLGCQVFKEALVPIPV